MIIEYYDEFQRGIEYKYLTWKVIRTFDEYLMKNKIPLEEAYDNIFAFSETCIVSKKSQRNYRTRLRRFIEYIYREEGIPVVEEDTIKIKVGE